MDAYQYLEDLQERAYSVRGDLAEALQRRRAAYRKEFQKADGLFQRMLDSRESFTSDHSIRFDKERMRRECERMFEEQLNRATPTIYEDPATYFILTALATEAEAAANTLGLTAQSPPAWGTLPTMVANATAIAVPGVSRHIVAIDQGLFVFAHEFSKTVALAMPFVGQMGRRIAFSSDTSAIDRRLDESTDVQSRFRTLVLSHVQSGSPIGAVSDPIPEPYLTLAGFIRDSLELFIVSHEYAHVALGHLSEASPTASVLSGKTVQVVAFNWQQETQADVVGLTIMLQATVKRRWPLAMSFWGADSFFACADVLDRSVSLVRYGTEEESLATATHPPAAMRRQSIREALGSVTEGWPKDEVEGAVAFADAISHITQRLWAATKQSVRALAAKADGPASIWDTPSSNADGEFFARTN